MAFEQTHGTWGCRLRTHKFANGIVTLLFLEPQKRCSWHKHDSTWNQFVVASGKLGVKTEKGYTTTLTEKQAFTVEPGVLHEFQTYELPTIVEEIAWVQYDENDIQRERIGGPLDDG